MCRLESHCLALIMKKHKQELSITAYTVDIQNTRRVLTKGNSVLYAKILITVSLIETMVHTLWPMNPLDSELTRMSMVHVRKRQISIIMTFVLFCLKRIGANIRMLTCAKLPAAENLAISYSTTSVMVMALLFARDAVVQL